MKIVFHSLLEIMQFADCVCQFLDDSVIESYDFLTPSQRDCIRHAVYDFTNIFNASDYKSF